MVPDAPTSYAVDRSFHSSVCGKLLYEPVNFFYIMLKLIFLSLYTLIWTSLVLIGVGLWLVYAVLLFAFSILKFLVEERHVIGLRFHVKILRCHSINWRATAVVVSGLFGFIVLYVFTGDVGLNWLSESITITVPMLDNPNTRYYWIAPSFFVCIILYATTGAPNIIYDLECLDAALMQNVVYNSHGNEYNEESGIIIQKLGMALAIHNDRTDDIDVIHSRDVLRVGVSTKEADELKLVDNTNNEMENDSKETISETINSRVLRCSPHPEGLKLT